VRDRMKKSTDIRGLYAITQNIVDSNHLIDSVGQALAGGVRILQYRNKSGDAALRLSQASALQSLCKQWGALFLINDDIPLAARLQADGVHLGREDGAIAAARSQLGARAIIGASCYNDIELARQARAAGADYVAFGAMFASGTKPGAVHAPLAILGQARELGLPVVAIGGITPGNASEVIAAGADAIAVINGIFAASDPGHAARSLSRLFS